MFNSCFFFKFCVELWLKIFIVEHSCLGALEPFIQSTADVRKLKESLALSQPITVPWLMSFFSET